MQRVSYGMPQLIELNWVEENVRLCSQLGLDFIELNCNLPSCQPETMNVHYLNLLKDQYGIEFTLHLPEDLDLGHFNRHVREAHLKVLEEAIGVADRLGCKILNIHMNPGVHFTLPTEKIELYGKYQQQYLSSIKSSLELIDIWLGGTGVHISIENTGLLHRPHIQTAVNQLLKSGRFCLTWDVGHDYISSHADREFMLNHRSSIKHIHLHDAKGRNDHLELYTGEVDLNEKLQIASENQASVLIEVKTKESLIHSVAKLKEKHIFK